MDKKTQGPFRSPVCGASKPVSRVLSFKTAIYLDVPSPVRSSRLLNTAGPACMCSHGVAPDRVYSNGRLTRHWVSSYLAFPPLPRRYKLRIAYSAACGGVHSLRCASSPTKPRAGFAGAPIWGTRRTISVALFLGSPPAGVTCYPCPVEPGLSSRGGLSACTRGCPAYLQILIVLHLWVIVKWI